MIYLLCLSELAALTAVFFGLAHEGFRSFGRLQHALRLAVATPLLISGIAHLAAPGIMAQMIPPLFPAPRLLVVLSGLAELAGAAGLFVAKTRRSAALSIALLMIAVFPANIFVAGRTIGGIPMPPVAVRLFLQMVYIVLVLAAGWGWPVRRSR